MLKNASVIAYGDFTFAPRYHARIPLESIPLPGVQALFVQRGNNLPAYAGKAFAETNIALVVEIISGSYDELLQAFNVLSEKSNELIVNDGTREWSINATVVGINKLDNNMTVIMLQAAEGVWRTRVANQQVFSNVSSFSVTVGSNHETYPVFEIKPTSASGDYLYKRFVTVYNNTAFNLVNYPLDIANAGLDTASLIAAGKMQASGDDLRVFMDGFEVPRWLYDLNTASTKVWCTLTLAGKIELSLAQAIPASGAVSTIYVMKNNANKNALTALSIVTHKLLLIDSELFTFDSVDVSSYSINGVVRAQRGSTAAAHSAGATIRWVEHDVWVLYGNPSSSTPEFADTLKPIFSLSSTNASWTFNEFKDSVNPSRPGSWLPAVEKSRGKKSETYTATQIDYADIATVAGVVGMAYQVGSHWKAENCSLSWTLYVPSGVSGFTVSSGKKYRAQTSFPASAMYYTTTYPTARWKRALSISSPSAKATWETWSGSASGFTGLAIKMSTRGTIAAKADNFAALEMDDVTVNIANPPSVLLSAEQSNYMLNITIQNNATAEQMILTTAMNINQVLTVDCEQLTAQIDDGQQVYVNLDSPRSRWMQLIPGENTFSILPSGSGLDITVRWNERNLL